jgi:acetyltransferase-like isoleucine patch superfamily enzyme
MSGFIHRLAYVDVSVQLGNDCVIWQFASLTRGTRLGNACSVAPGTHLDGPKFGDRCVIGHNVAMGPGFEFGDDCFVGPGVVMANDAFPAAHKENWDIAAFQNGAVAIRVGNRVTIGASAVVLPGVTIGDDACLAAGAVCGINVPACHLFTRSGSLSLIPDRLRRMRMKVVK